MRGLAWQGGGDGPAGTPASVPSVSCPRRDGSTTGGEFRGFAVCPCTQRFPGEGGGWMVWLLAEGSLRCSASSGCLIDSLLANPGDGEKKSPRGGGPGMKGKGELPERGGGERGDRSTRRSAPLYQGVPNANFKTCAVRSFISS